MCIFQPLTHTNFLNWQFRNNLNRWSRFKSSENLTDPKYSILESKWLSLSLCSERLQLVHNILQRKFFSLKRKDLPSFVVLFYCWMYWYRISERDIEWGYFWTKNVSKKNIFKPKVFQRNIFLNEKYFKERCVKGK